VYAFLLQVISNMRVLMTEDSNNAVSSSFLLDDDSRSVNNISFSFTFCIIEPFFLLLISTCDAHFLIPN